MGTLSAGYYPLEFYLLFVCPTLIYSFLGNRLHNFVHFSDFAAEPVDCSSTLAAVMRASG